MNYLRKIGLFTILNCICLLTGCNTHKHDFEILVDYSDCKTTYLTGQDFNPEGLKFKRVCKECGLEEKLTSFVMLDGDELTEDIEEVSVRVDKKIVYIPITVKNSYKVACCGDSLTYGHAWPNEAYPVYINDYAEHVFEIKNCAENGLSITGYGGSYNNPNQRYQLRDVYNTSISFNPDVVILGLGSNDATGWANAKDQYEERYKELIDSYIEKLGEGVKFIMIVSPPTLNPNSFNIPNDVIKNNVNPIQRELAEEYGMEMLDLRELFEEKEGGYTSFIRPGDGVHLSVDGAKFVAEQIAQILEQI